MCDESFAEFVSVGTTKSNDEALAGAAAAEANEAACDSSEEAGASEAMSSNAVSVHETASTVHAPTGIAVKSEKSNNS